MNYKTTLLSCILVAGILVAGCSDDDSGDTSETAGSGGSSAGAGGAAGKGGAQGSKGGASNNGGATANGGTGGGGSGMPIQCPGGSPTCDDNTAWYCDGAMPTMSPCGKSECQSGKCVCTSDTQCQADEDKSWVECACKDGQTVKKTGNEIATCDTGTGQCAEFKVDTVCSAVCKDNGGSGTLTDFHFEM